MHIVKWHKFQFERLWQIHQWETIASIWSSDIYARPCPRISSGTISVPDQRILGEHWIFDPPIVHVYYDIK